MSYAVGSSFPTRRVSDWMEAKTCRSESGRCPSTRRPPNVGSRTVTVSTTDVNVAFKIVTSVTQPTVQIQPRVSGQFTLRVPAQNGPRYIIEATGVLPPAPALPTWNTITNTFGTGSPIDVSDPGSAGPSAVQRFYRVRILQ
mgnify:CR=1 FL=1